MSIITRLGALGALSVLAACGTSTSGNAPVSADVSEIFAAAATFTPTFDDGETGAQETAESEGGLSGVVGREDGTLVPVNVRIDREANTFTITYGDETPIVLTNDSEDGGSNYWSNEDMRIYSYGGSSYFYFHDMDCCGPSTDLALFTDPGDLPTEGQVGYTGYFNMEGAEGGASGSLALAVDFGTNQVAGNILGSLYNDEICCFIREPEEGPGSEGPSGDSFYGGLSGALSDGLIAASGSVTGTVDGDVSLLGGFTNDGYGILGGIAGTIDDQTMGGEFGAGSGRYYD